MPDSMKNLRSRLIKRQPEISKEELTDWTWMGLVNGDIVGKTGIEEEYEEKLYRQQSI